MKQAVGRAWRRSASQRAQSSVSRALRQASQARRVGSLAVGRAREVEAAGGAEVPPAVLAVTVGLVGPAVGEDAVDVVARHDLAVHGGHEVEVVGAERAGDPQLGVGPVPARRAVRVDGDPVGVRASEVVARRMRIGARDHRHVHRAAAAHQVAEGIAGAEPGAAVVQRDVGGVVGDDAAGAEAGRVGVHALEVVEPERQVEPAGIVLDQHELGPAHRALAPRGRRRTRPDGRLGHGGGGGLGRGAVAGCQRSGGGAADQLDERAPVEISLKHGADSTCSRAPLHLAAQACGGRRCDAAQT